MVERRLYRGGSQSTSDWAIGVVYVMLLAMIWGALGTSLSGLFEWLNCLPEVQKGIAEIIIASGICTIGVAAWWTAKQLVGVFWSISRYEQWSALASQFYDIAERDTAIPKKKVFITQHGGWLKFDGGGLPSHAIEAQALSRSAGQLLRHSKVTQAGRWRRGDPLQRWVDFVTATTKSLTPEWAAKHIRDYDDEDEPGSSDRSFHFDVFPWAAYLVCKHCASFERPPQP